eukprot:1195778-Prorocentrum_minimum.AAC.1
MGDAPMASVISGLWQSEEELHEVYVAKVQELVHARELQVSLELTCIIPLSGVVRTCILMDGKRSREGSETRKGTRCRV